MASPSGADQMPGSSRLANRYSPRSVSRKAWSAGVTTSRTISRIRSRSASDATLTIEGTIAWSIGTASIRSIWAMVRSVTIRGAVRPGGHPVAEELGVRGHVRGVGVQPRDERLEPLGRVGRLELGQLGEQLLGTAHLVHDPQLLEVLLVLLEVEGRDDHEHVPRDPGLGGEAVDRDGGRLLGGPLHQRAERGPAVRSRIGEAVRVARVAVDGRDGRLELEHGLPVAAGQVVDGRGERIGRCHGGVVLLV